MLPLAPRHTRAIVPGSLLSPRQVHRHDRRAALCEECATRIKVAGVHCHPDFDTATFDADIAVLVLAENVSAAAYELSHVVLDASGTFEADGAALIVAGWGATNTNTSAPVLADKAMAVEVEAIATETCTSAAWTYNSSAVTTNMLCAGYRDDAPRDACVVRSDVWLLLSLSSSPSSSSPCGISSIEVQVDRPPHDRWCWWSLLAVELVLCCAALRGALTYR